MPFVYSRTARFQDTDAAGVVYFANVLSMCHEAYEASLAASGIELQRFFSRTEIAVPIVHASVDFWKPMRCGDHLEIHLIPRLLNSNSFEIQYQIFPVGNADKAISTALTRHVCIDTATRSRVALPDFLSQWLQCWTIAPEPTESTDCG